MAKGFNCPEPKKENFPAAQANAGWHQIERLPAARVNKTISMVIENERRQDTTACLRNRKDTASEF
jgi:hypothetical protein